MNKQELLHRLKVAGLLDRFKDVSEWQDAFMYYNAVHGGSLKPNCSRCFRTVREWLNTPDK